jgi:hypothetical protein
VEKGKRLKANVKVAKGKCKRQKRKRKQKTHSRKACGCQIKKVNTRQNQRNARTISQARSHAIAKKPDVKKPDAKKAIAKGCLYTPYYSYISTNVNIQIPTTPHLPTHNVQ